MKKKTEEDLFLEEIGGKIQYYRIKAGIKQEDMADGEYPIEYKYFQKIEYGKKNITLKTIYKICKKIGVKPSKLFE